MRVKKQYVGTRLPHLVYTEADADMSIMLA
jgi:hypothetical protein